MTIYVDAPAGTLRFVDMLHFRTPQGVIEGTVLRSFVAFYHVPNGEIFTRLGITDRYAFCEKAYGYKPGRGDWPQYRDDDYRALTRLVRKLFIRLRKITTTERISVAADADTRATYRAGLPKPAQRFLDYMDDNPHAFGSQREHVIAAVGCILDTDLKPALGH
jgi:hypothetical protein